MEKRKIFSFVNKIGILGIILMVIIGFYLILAKSTHLWPFDKGYQVVVLNTGEIYFGHLKLFPRPTLTDVYLIQTQKDEKGNVINQQLVPVSQGLVFGPKSKLYLSSSKIVWWADLGEESHVLNLIKSQKRTSALAPSQASQTSQGNSSQIQSSQNQSLSK